MARTFPTISWLMETEAGSPVAVPAGVDVVASIAGSDVATYTTDSSGQVASASIVGAVAGDVAIFRIENHEGLAGCVSVKL